MAGGMARQDRSLHKIALERDYAPNIIQIYLWRKLNSSHLLKLQDQALRIVRCQHLLCANVSFETLQDSKIPCRGGACAGGKQAEEEVSEGKTAAKSVATSPAYSQGRSLVRCDSMDGGPRRIRVAKTRCISTSSLAGLRHHH